jgi:uncharacterized membrane protein YhaH (DUF805 family)
MTTAQRGVGLSTAISIAFSKYAVFFGRASRSEYWWFALFSFLCYLVATLIGAMLGRFINNFLHLILFLIFFLPSISLAVRRLHDTNRSGWWWWICLVPVIGAIVLLIFLVLEPVDDGNRFN